ncbi:MAG: hypothetical protein WCK11_02190 [Candidatus Falkowbacteria bacterium]
MFGFIRSLLSRRFATASYNWLNDNTDRYQQLLFGWFTTNMIILVIAATINCCNGPRWINLVGSIIFTITATFFATKPRNIAFFYGLGKAIKKDYLTKYQEVVVGILLYNSIILLFLGTVSLANNPIGIIVILAAGLVIFFADIAWGMTTRLLKPLIYWYAVGVIIFTCCQFVPSSTWVRTVGFDPLPYFRTSTLEDRLATIDNLQATVAPRRDVATLNAIIAKLENGGTLTPHETSELKRIRSERSMTGKVAHAFSNVSEKRHFVGQGYGEGDIGEVNTLLAGRDYKKGDTIVVEGGNFQVFHGTPGKWREYTTRLDIPVTQTPPGWFAVKAPKGTEFLVCVIKK